MAAERSLRLRARARAPRAPSLPRSARTTVVGALLLAAGAAGTQTAGLALDLGMWDEALAWILGGGAVLCGSLAAALAGGGDRRSRRGWLLWAGGGAFVVAGAAAAVLLILASGSAPHAAYVPWLGFAICAIAGLALRSARGLVGFPLFLLDAIPLMIAAVAFIRPNGRNAEWRGVSGELVAVAFPALFVLLALIATEVVLLEQRDPLDSVMVAAAGFALMAVACIVWVSPRHGGFAHDQWADALWTLAALLVAGAGCRTALAGAAEARSAVLAGDSGARALLPLLGVAALALLLVEQYGRYHALVWATIVAVVMLAARFVVSRHAADLALDRERALRTEVEQARTQLSEQNVRLRELDQLKDALLASVSHELRTPLTAIRGYLQIVTDEESGALNDEQLELLGIVSRNVVRLERIINDLLFLAQSDAGMLSLDKTDVDLDTVAEEAVAAARPAARAKNIQLHHAGDHVRLLADRDRIAQILDNLVTNAIKFTPDGGSVTLTTARRRDAAVLVVADTGIGIGPDEQERLFQRFYRTETATRQAIPGTGLGLSIVKAIVEAHDGGITVQSRENEGTTFRVTLPAGPS